MFSKGVNGKYHIVNILHVLTNVDILEINLLIDERVS